MFNEVESLEERRFLSVSLNNATHVLTVTGGNGADKIAVSLKGTNLTATVNGTAKSFKAAAVRKLVLNGGAGNDRISVAQNVNVSATLNGGTGNDLLAGGGAGDTIVGGTGLDIETGGAGNDTLVGGAGNDKLTGGAGNDTEDGGDGNDVEDGGDGNDLEDGGAGDDNLSGGAGADTLNGGVGRNLIRGGGGRDHFQHVARAADTVADKSAEDQDDADENGTGDNETGEGDTAGEDLEVEGTVAAVDATTGSLTLTGENGRQQTFSNLAGVPVTVNGTPGSLADVTVGAKAEVKLTVDAAGNQTVVGLKVKTGSTSTGGGDHQGQDHEAEGVVSAVDPVGNTITLAGRNGAPDRVFAVSPTASVRVDGVSSTLGQVPVAAKAELKFVVDAAGNQTVTGIKVETEGQDD